ncbi:MAG: aminotransferase class I/II-fold pyridoxal phosphate-dependent enzyme [Methanosarcinales archaeon]|nr:aminotransferase class I/II-fold pyridoxal phosphate-dependent enzyme [Methanosarcinales archaeon]
MNMQEEIGSVVDAVRKHHELYKNALPMIASENIASNTVRTLLASDLSHRYAEGDVGNRFYQGCEYIDEVEEKAIRYAKELFEAEHVNVKPTSGVNANIAALFALTSPGDKIMALSVPDGGHISHSRYSVPAMLNLKLEQLPFDPNEMNIDAAKMVKAIKEKKPELILLGGSLFLFPHPILEAREAADEVGAKIVYDASHVLGLIAGKKFQDPLREEADVVTSSTHKTFPGPQGAIILCKEALKDEIDKAVFPGTVSNHHLHHVAGLAVTLVEMKHFGVEYASRILSNAKVLAESLYEEGFEVLCEHKGFTESHQIAVDVRGYGGGDAVAKKLERANIITNKNMLPFDEAPEEPSGIRFGVQELARIGMKESEMREIASLIRRVTIEGEDEKKIKEEVIELRAGFQHVQYCFDGKDAYKFPEGLSF